MKAIFSRELDAHFSSLTGNLFCAFVLLFAGIYTMAINLNGSYGNFEFVLSTMSFIFLITIPILTMRVIAEERRQRTDQLLYSLPLSMGKIVLGKYFALLTVLAVPVGIMALYPLVLSMYGNMNLATSYSAVIGFFLLGAALIAIGMFISSLTENQGLAAGFCFVVLLVNYFLPSLAEYMPKTATGSLVALAAAVLVFGVILFFFTKNVVLSATVTVALEAVLFVCYSAFGASFEGLFPNIMKKLSVFDQFNPFVNGVFDVVSVVYFLTVSAVFVYLTVQSLEKRRWS